ncbi:hypothetical protein ES702_00536 [subsurface metagenome]
MPASLKNNPLEQVGERTAVNQSMLPMKIPDDYYPTSHATLIRIGGQPCNALSRLFKSGIVE